MTFETRSALDNAINCCNRRSFYHAARWVRHINTFHPTNDPVALLYIAAIRRACLQNWNGNPEAVAC